MGLFRQFFFFFLLIPGWVWAAPTNDQFDKAASASYQAVFRGSNIGATLELGEPELPAQPNSGQSVWYSWTADYTTTVIFETNGSNFDTVLGIYVGNSLNSLTYLGGDDNSGRNNASQVALAVTKGITYRICIRGAGNATGDFYLTLGHQEGIGFVIVLPPAPTEEGGNMELTFMRLGGRTGAGSITVQADFGASNTTAGSSDVSSAVLPVYFADGQTLSTVQLPILEDQISEFDEVFALQLNRLPGPGLSPLTNPQIYGTILDNERPGNDSYLTPTVIEGTTGNITFSNQGASPQEGEPAYKQARSHSIWYRWTAPADGVFEWSFSNVVGENSYSSNRPTALFFGTDLVKIPAQAQDFTTPFSNRTVVKVTAGTTYQILVDDIAGAETFSSGKLNWKQIFPGTFGFPSETVIAQRNAGNIVLTIQRTGGTAGGFGFSYVITPITASAANLHNLTAGANGNLSGNLQFANGATSASITIQTDDDGNRVGGETFSVSFSNLVPYLPFGITTITVSIYENDFFAEAAPLTGQSGSTSANIHAGVASLETGEPAHGPAGLPSPQAYSVWYDWIAPTSSAYVFSSSTEGSNRVGYFSVYTGDSLETLTRVEPLPTASGNSVRQAFMATAGIHYKIGVQRFTNTVNPTFLSWEPGSTVGFDANSYTVSETDGTLSFQVVRTGALDRTAGIAISTENITTTEADYTPTNLYLNFAPDEASKTVTIPITQDQKHEVTERFRVRLQSPTGNAYALVDQAEVAIVSPESFVARRASFVANLKIGPAAAQQGSFIGAMTATAKFTGKLRYGGKTYNLSAKLNAHGAATVNLRKVGGGTLVLKVESTDNTGRLVLTLTDGTNTGTAAADLRPYDGKSLLAPSFGYYTARIDAEATATAPGIATVKVGLNGAVKMAGSLADGSPFTVSSFLTVPPDSGPYSSFAPIHLPLYLNSGYMSGTLVFSEVDEAPLGATVSWNKPALSTAKYYPLGIDAQAQIKGSRYTPPTKHTRALPGLVSNGLFQIDLSGPGIVSTSGPAYWLINNLISTGLFTNPKLALKVSSKTGLISGSLAIPGTKSFPLKAIILQGSEEIAGFYLHAPTKTTGSIYGAE